MSTAVVAEWTSADITVHCDPKLPGDEWRKLQGWIHPDAPGLAVTPYQGDGAYGDEWVVTHVRSGLFISDGDSLASAQTRALLLAQLTGGFDIEQIEVAARSRAWKQAAKLIGNAEPRTGGPMRASHLFFFVALVFAVAPLGELSCPVAAHCVSVAKAGAEMWPAAFFVALCGAFVRWVEREVDGVTPIVRAKMSERDAPLPTTFHKGDNDGL